MDGTDGEDGSLGADGWLLTVLFEEGLEVGVLGFVCAVGFVSAGSVMVTRIVCFRFYPVHKSQRYIHRQSFRQADPEKYNSLASCLDRKVFVHK